VKPGTISHLLVAAQFGGVALAAFPFAGAQAGPVAALGACAAGALLGAATLAHNRIGNFGVYPEPRTGARLITSGPYALIRHPMYTSLMLVMAGIAAWNGHPLNWAGLALTIAAVASKAAREERYLGTLFDDYDAYRARTRWFIPWLL